MDQTGIGLKNAGGPGARDWESHQSRVMFRSVPSRDGYVGSLSSGQRLKRGKGLTMVDRIDLVERLGGLGSTSLQKRAIEYSGGVLYSIGVNLWRGGISHLHSAIVFTMFRLMMFEMRTSRKTNENVRR